MSLVMGMMAGEALLEMSLVFVPGFFPLAV
jgi:hypothetical protein